MANKQKGVWVEVVIPKTKEGPEKELHSQFESQL